MSDWLNYLVFGWYPYVAFAVFLLGGWLRFDGKPHIQPDGSGRLFSRRQTTLGVTLFHTGVLILFVGHLVGLLTPIQVFEFVGISHGFKQSMANVIGGTAGTVALIGLVLLLRNRLNESRTRPRVLFGDVAILLLIFVQIGLGLSTIPVALAKMSSGCEALPLMWWAQSIATLKPAAAAGFIAGMPLIFKLHIVNGLTIALVFPFTRLVNIWSVPAWFLSRQYSALGRQPSPTLGGRPSASS
jgi:nitrate reductase gamma subunit